MSTALSNRRDYLIAQRRAIIARSLASIIAESVPVPMLDDWAKSAVLGGGYRRIAASHQIDLDSVAIQNLVHGRAEPVSWSRSAFRGIVGKIAGRATRRMLFAVATARGATAASRTFVTMTLFNHYCARLHTGLGLDGDRALAVREEIDRAVHATSGALSLHPFRRGAVAAIKGMIKAPLELADMASAGGLRRLLSRKSDIAEPEALAEIDTVVESELAKDSSFFARAVVAVEAQLSAESNPYVDDVIDAFDRQWRARMAANE
jgi:hypothetical protein